ncbi:MAG TPA: OmpA family protein [Oligoflexus sp.]|uniref:OmpA family protein n=1 Tax=Oligoflexus sp. TaxID=1971216 RepID=UPI002D4B9330|nr:OmpA family protein [Oligoflexus sp.]HYX34713.1 OmpA family protein [Oligoflexus sp.]
MKHLKLQLPSAFFLLFALGFGCVSASEHTLLERRLAASETRLMQTRNELDRLQNERDRLRKHVDTYNVQVGELNSELHSLDNKQKAARLELERAKAANRELSESLDEKDKALGLAARSKDEQKKMFEAYRNKLKKLIESEDLTVSLVDGKLVLSLPSDILFASGSAQISERGQDTFMELGRILQSLNDKRLQIEGHTDNNPIRGGRYASNWHLGHGRAMAVVDILIKTGVPASQLSAASYGEHHPKGPNIDDASRQRNRRIEIVIIPHLGVLAEEPVLDDAKYAH